MRILIVHNLYQQPGGEDAVFFSEADLLRDAGHQVDTLQVSNDEITNLAVMASTAASAIYNWQSRDRVSAALRTKRYDVLHVHNFFPKLSPSIFDAAREAGVASVLTLHNYRLTCAAGTLFRDGDICQQCVGRPPLPAVTHRCYRGSIGGSASVAAMIQVHKWAGTWHRKIDRFIALSSFAIELFGRAGLPQGRIRVKPNFVPDDAAFSTGGALVDQRTRDGFIFVGRLSPEKGCDMLVAAWRSIGARLTIIGDGPEINRLRAAAPANVSFAGRQNAATVRRAMAGARAVIVPSRWFETFGLVAVEAMMTGTPVIASRVGALPDIVDEGITGLLVTAGDVGELTDAVLRLSCDDAAVATMGAAGRARYEACFTPHRNLAILESIYEEAINSHHAIEG